MIPLRNQRTIAQSVCVEGFGYWSGQDIQVEFRPAPPGTGRVFVLEKPGRTPVLLPATIDARIDAQRRTILEVGTARVEMIEHVLAALAALEVDNCEIWVDAEEMPGCDGSSNAFVDAIEAVGLVDQPLPIDPLVVRQAIRAGDDKKWIEAQPSPTGQFSIEYHLDYGPGNAIGRQSFAAVITSEQFRYELAPARTFVLAQEADAMQAQGKGTRVTSQDILIFDQEGPRDNPLRFADECVRHKILDVVGDLALAGRPLIGHFVAHCSGHQLNGDLVGGLLKQEATQQRRRSA